MATATPITRRNSSRRGLPNARGPKLSPGEREAVRTGHVFTRGDGLDQFFRARLVAIEMSTNAAVQRVAAARRVAADAAGPGCSITEDVVTARGNSGNGSLNSGQIKQPARGEADDVNALLDDPRVARFSMA